MTNEIFAARLALIDAREACSRGAYPGSKAAMAESAAMAALDAFDAANPGVKKAWFAMDEDARFAVEMAIYAAANA